MKRPFPRFEVLGFAAALAAGAACTPNNSVKPGAPMLLEMWVVEPGGATVTEVNQMTLTCPSTADDGKPCPTSLFPATPVSAAQTVYTPCETASQNFVCRCIPNPTPAPTPVVDAGPPDAGSDAATSDAAVADASASDAAPPPPLDGMWSCTYAPTSTVVSVFDRLIDTAPFSLDGGVTNVATVMANPPNPLATETLATYNPTGLQNGTFFLPPAFPDGPSITAVGSPALPAAGPTGTVTVTLNNMVVLAKDGRTPFVGTGLLIGGAVTFKTAAFAVSLTQPTPGSGDAGLVPLMMTPATATFNNTISTATLGTHITASATPGGAVPLNLTSMDGLNVTISPQAATGWDPNATIVITIDAATPDVVGDTLGTAGTVTFNTGSM